MNKAIKRRLFFARMRRINKHIPTQMDGEDFREYLNDGGERVTVYYGMEAYRRHKSKKYLNLHIY